MDSKHKESLQQIENIMVQNNIKESDKPSFLTAFSLGMTFATDKFTSYVETSKLLKEVAK